jgi:uncharacterized protein (DUF362 family)
MQAPSVALSAAPRTDPEVVDAMALLARELGMVVHVIAPRGPGLLEHARDVAEQGGLNVKVDSLAYTTRIRFEP